jgi:DNA-binding LacI/PurR family transcriptional regulator
MGVSIEDVAHRAGVSTATVSRALRNLPNVSAVTRQRVLEVAAELDYVITPLASRLASGRTNSIAVVSPYIGTWFFGQVLTGIERILHAQGLDLLLFALPDERAQDDFFASMPLRRRVDGVIILTLGLTSQHQDMLRGLGVPMASVGDPLAESFSVGIDNVGAAEIATHHLINLGHTRIAMIGGGTSFAGRFTAPRQRQRGFTQAMADAGLEVPGDYDVDGEYTVSGGASAMAELLSLRAPPTAVFAQSDEMAAGAMQVMRRMGVRVPEDISIVGFDDHEMAEVLDLTTMAQPVTQRGEIAVRAVLDAMAAGSTHTKPERELLHTRLVVRSSTAPFEKHGGSR